MSVVNKMLNDLEKRKANASPSANYVPSSKSDNNNKVILLLVFMLIILGAVLVWLTSSKTSTNSIPQSTQTVQVNEKTELGLDELSGSSNIQLKGVVDSSQITEIGTVDADGETGLDSEVEVVFNNETPEEFAQRLSEEQRVNNANSEKMASSPKVNSAGPNTDSPKPQLTIKPSLALPSPRDLEKSAQVALKNGDKRAAQQALTNLVRAEPSNSDARKKLASLLFGDGSISQASEVLNDGLTLVPEDSSMRMMLSRLMFRNAQNEAALELLKAQPEVSILDEDYLSFRAALAENQKDYGQSVQDYQSLIKRQPNNARWWLGLGVSLDKQGQTKQASEAYQRVRSLDQLSSEVMAFVEQRLAVIEG